MKVLIDIPQDHKRVIDNFVVNGKGYLLPHEVGARLAKEVKRGTVILNNCEMCERYDRTGKTECNVCNFKLACIPLVLIKETREEIQKYVDILSDDTVASASMKSGLGLALEKIDKLIAESEGTDGRNNN